MTPEEGKKLWAEAQANGRLLDACPGPHDFVDLTPEKPVGKHWRCQRCGGEVDGGAKRWYEAGLRHGRQAPV